MTKQVKYRLAVQAGYKANLVKIGSNLYDPDAVVNKTNYPDIEITRPGIETDFSLLHNQSLLTVNGFIKPTVYDNHKLYIPNVTEDLLKSRSNHIGILTFNTNITKTPITDEMVTSDGDYPLYQKAIITFPEEVDTAFLVVAGYPIFEQDNFFYRISNKSFVLRLDRLSYVERIYELERYRNILDELELERSQTNPSMLDGFQLRSDETVRKLLTLDNSLIVSIPNHDLSVKKVYLEHSNVPGNFRTQEDPILPLVAGYGKFCEYKAVKKNSHKFTVHTTDAYFNKHLFSKMSTDKLHVYNDHREPGRTYELSQAFFLDISLTPN